jgi:hypothetical protein
VRYRKVNYGRGEYDEPVYHPLADVESAADVESHHWPDPADFDYESITKAAVDDVIREVRESVDIFRGVRWICAPCHNIQPGTPTRNIVALYETIQQLGGSGIT